MSATSTLPLVLVGIGGLGAPAAATLVQAGARHLRLIDDDRVELSNLPRQPLFGTGDLGQLKVEAAARRLEAFAGPGGLHVEALALRLDGGNADALLEGALAVLDGTDGLPSKLALNDAAVRQRVPLVHAGALGTEGQLMTILPGETACVRCLFPELRERDDFASCQQAGILGPVVGAVGVRMAAEGLALSRGERPSLAGRLAMLDGVGLRWRTIEVRRNAACPGCGHAALAP